VGEIRTAHAGVPASRTQDIPCHISLRGSKVMLEEPYALIGHVRICGGPGG
jgi:hypothetical protein